MDIAFISGTKRIWSNSPDIAPEEPAITQLVNACFVPAPQWRAWLMYHKKSGGGVAVAVGPIRPLRRRLKKHAGDLQVAEVHKKFQALLATEGPSALRWDGKAVVARGH